MSPPVHEKTPQKCPWYFELEVVVTGYVSEVQVVNGTIGQDLWAISKTWVKRPESVGESTRSMAHHRRK